jgi:hypothetical protein
MKGVPRMSMGDWLRHLASDGLYWTLVDGKPVPTTDVLAWAQWLESAPERQVAKTEIGSNILVSTVFLGMNHNFNLQGPPVLWETMVFGGPRDGDMDRYTSRAAAEVGHLEMVERIKATNNKGGRPC